MNRYIKLPLVMGTIYALLQVLLFWFEDGLTEKLFYRATSGFIVFAVYGLVLTFIHSQIVKRKVELLIYAVSLSKS